MNRKYDSNGKLRIPIVGKIAIPEDKVATKSGNVIVDKAYCPNGHDIMSGTKVNGHKGINFIYSALDGSREVNLVLSSVVGKTDKVILSGEPFSDGEIIKILCPTCHVELDVLVTCECGAPVYIFYLDKQRRHQYGQSFCSRIECSKSSRFKFSQEVLADFIKDNCF